MAAEGKMSDVVVDVIFKFGGSAITDKNHLEHLLPQQLALAAKCVRQCRDAGLTCIVVHGAGSFGHFQARKFQVNSGLTGTEKPEDQKKLMWGFCITRQSVTKLNTLVVDSLIEAGVSAVSCSPGSSWRTRNREPVTWPVDNIQGLLVRGLVPVLHGDCCLDSAQGVCILSGDVIIPSLCSFFKTRRVVFLTDVMGVFDRPPNEPDSNLLKSIRVTRDGSVSSAISTSQSKNDVTGGITLKLRTAVKIVTQSQGACPVVVCAVDSPDVFKAAQLNIDSLKDYSMTVINMEGD